jgi:hypothetical protein
VCFKFVGIVDVRNIEPKMFCHVYFQALFYEFSTNSIHASVIFIFILSSFFSGHMSNTMLDSYLQ